MALTWLRTVAKGDAKAERQFGKLYGLFHHSTTAYLRSPGVGLTEEEAEEVYQDTMRIVWRKAGTFDPIGRATVRTWICAIAQKVALHAKRARVRDNRNVALGAEWGTEAFDKMYAREAGLVSGMLPSIPEDTLATKQILERCLSELNGAQQVVLRLLHDPPISFQELAQILEVPLGTVKSRFNSAMTKLEECWTREALE